jgi:hypothetical protein
VTDNLLHRSLEAEFRVQVFKSKIFLGMTVKKKRTMEDECVAQ